MKLIAFLTCAAAALSSMSLVQAKISGTPQQEFEQHQADVFRNVETLEKAFTAYVGGSYGEAIGALKAGDQLGGNLTAATTLLYSQKLQPDSKDFEQTVRMYNRIEERIGKVTKLLADNRATIYRDKVEFIPKALLPRLEAYLDCFGSAFSTLKMPKATLAAVITAWENTDNLMEKVLVTFDAPDQTPDPNHTARDATKKEVDEYLANNGPITCPLPRVMKPVEAKAALANLV